MKKIILSLLFSSTINAVDLKFTKYTKSGKEVEVKDFRDLPYKPFVFTKEFDEEPFIHDYRHAAALQRALESDTTTQQEKDDYEIIKQKNKDYNGDWVNVEGPEDYETPVYYRKNFETYKDVKIDPRIEKKKQDAKKKDPKKKKGMSVKIKKKEIKKPVPKYTKQKFVEQEEEIYQVNKVESIPDKKEEQDANKQQKQSTEELTANQGDQEPDAKLNGEQAMVQHDDMAQSIAQIETKSKQKFSKKELLALGTELSRETAIPEDVDVQLQDTMVDKTAIQFINSKDNRLSWEEFKDDEKMPDQSEWHDQFLNKMKTNPDWGSDSIVKNYFVKAQKRKAAKQYVPVDDESDYVNNFVSVSTSERNRLESNQMKEVKVEPKKEKTKKVQQAPPKVEKKVEEDEPEQTFWNDVRGVCEKRVCE